jgi:GT2 family glycosyltransferase
MVDIEVKSGATAARNRGLGLATGAYVSFFDSDDEMSPDFIAAMLTSLLECPTAEFVAARSRMVFENGTEQVRSGLEGLSLSSHILSAALSTQSFLARTDFIRQIGGWNADVPIWNDYELGIRMLQSAHSFVTLDRTFHRIYQHADSITGASLGASFHKLQVALPLIEQQILTPCGASESPQRASVIALYFRLCILAGKLQAEGNRDAKLWITQRAKNVAQQPAVNKLKQLISSLLRTYSAHGGRGAWRIAVKCLNL